jgi:hypothetical protein
MTRRVVARYEMRYLHHNGPEYSGRIWSNLDMFDALWLWFVLYFSVKKSFNLVASHFEFCVGLPEKFG